MSVVLAFSDSQRAQVARLGSLGVPCALIDPQEVGATGVSSVAPTSWAGGVAAARHLIDLGHRRIAANVGPSTALCALARLDGLRSALLADLANALLVPLLAHGRRSPSHRDDDRR